jgi:hypothetical protein
MGSRTSNVGRRTVRGSRVSSAGWALLVAGSALLALAPSALAGTYSPTRIDDPTPNGCRKHDCSLREAITKANHHAGPDKVVLHGGDTYKLTRKNAGGVDEDLNHTGDLDITDTVRIVSSNKQLATVNANGIDRAFEVAPSGPATARFKYLGIRGGKTDGDGGAVLVAPEGVGKFVKSAITGNRALDGGGIYGDRTGSTTFSLVRVVSSTISGNTSTDVGGGVAISGSVSMTNSTVANNHTRFFGGGIEVFSGGSGNSVSLSSVTIVRNSTDSGGTGGGIRNNSIPGTLRNSLVALNSATTDPDCSTSGLSNGFGNLFTDLSPSAADCSAYGGGDILTPSPKLGQLKDNGGPTKTIPLLNHSPAIGNTDSNSPSHDQRGVKRDKHPDIGAFEKT